MCARDQDLSFPGSTGAANPRKSARDPHPYRQTGIRMRDKSRRTRHHFGARWLIECRKTQTEQVFGTSEHQSFPYLALRAIGGVEPNKVLLL